MCWICFSDQQLRSLTKNDLIGFVQAIIDNRTIQLQKLKTKMVFYLWHDEQAGQLRFSLISGIDPLDLPFGCNVNQTNNLNEILQDYKENNRDSIPFSEFVEVSFDELEDEEIEYELKVFSKVIG